MGKLNLTQVQLRDVEAVFEKHKNEESKGIKVHFKMDDSGIIEIDKVVTLLTTLKETFTPNYNLDCVLRLTLPLRKKSKRKSPL